MTHLGLIFGIVLATLGYLGIQWHAHVEQPGPFTFTPDQQAAYDAHVRQALQAVASAPVVPMQRQAGEWS